MVDGDEPVQIKVECIAKRSTPVKTAADISPHNSGTVTVSEKSSIDANRRSNIGFPASHNQGRVLLLTSPKWGSDAQSCRFSQKFRQKTSKSLLQSFVVLKTSSGKVVAQSTTYRTVSKFWQEMSPFP